MDALARLFKRIMTRRAQLTVLSAGAVLCFVATAIVTAQVFFKVNDYRTASSDNILWTVAKLEVEHAKYINAIENLRHGDRGALQEMRQRFDIFFSRVDTIATAPNYREALATPRAREFVQLLVDSVREQAAIIDAGAAEVVARQDELFAKAESLSTPIVRLSSVGITHDAARRDAQRSALVTKLTHLIALSLALLATLFALLALFWQLYVRYRRRALQNRTVLNRLATIINTSQDAIVVVCPSGEILEGNRVAHAIFGLPYAGKTRKKIQEILTKFDEEGNAQPVTAEKLIASCANGPNLCTKLSARDQIGRVFPVELSASMATRSGDYVCVCFLRDISERVENEAEMHAARDKALAGERAKARFLGMISHEMRTPLNGILGALDLLDDTPLTPEQSRYTQIMQSSGQLVLNQINDALDMTQADIQHFSLSSDRFDLDALLNALVQGQQAQAKAHNSSIELRCSPPVLGPVLGDQYRLHQVLLNLVSNAIKFTRNGEIRIEVTRLGPPDAPGDDIEFQISDTGIGISEKDLPRIFDDFVRHEEQNPSEGTGLGLGIAKHLVTLMGGTIGAESVYGEGSLFWVRVPVPRARHTSDMPPRSEMLTAVMPSLSVLVVEDNETSRFVLHEMLRKDGHSVTLTDNGRDAVIEANTKCYDIIFMDINMPGIDGIEATRQIRCGTGESRESRIIALTAHYGPENTARFAGVRIDAIYSKPLRRAVLRDILSGGPVRERAEEEKCGVDTQVLDQLCAVLPAQNLARVLDNFIIEGQKFIDSLEAIRTQPKRKLAADLHQFAGSAATFGAIALQTTLCRAERAALADDKEGLEAEFITLPDLWQDTTAEINSRRRAA